MRISYVYDTIYPYTKGGVEKRIWELSTRLTQRRHEVHIFGPKFWSGPSVYKRDGVYLHGVCAPAKKRFVNGRRSIKEPIYFAWMVLPALLKEKFDIIDVANLPYFPCFSAKIDSVLRRIPLVISWYEIWGNYWYEYLGPKGILGKVIERMTVGLPRRIIVETKSNKEILVSWGYGPNKIAVIPSGVSFERIQRTPCINGENKGDDVIFVGRLIRAKGIHTLVESIGYLKKNHKRVNVSIIGDGPERENLKALAKELDIEEEVKFHGEVAADGEVISLMKSAKVFVYPAVPEGGWALTIAEANACGLPVVSVKSGALGTNEAVIDGYNGLLVDKQSPELIAEKISFILGNNHLREELKRNALNLAQTLDWENQAEAIEKVYQDALKNHH